MPERFPVVTDVQLSARPFDQYEMLTFGARREPFSELAVRRAAARAIDWSALARTVYLDVDLPGWGDVFPRSWAYTPRSPASTARNAGRNRPAVTKRNEAISPRSRASRTTASMLGLGAER